MLNKDFKEVAIIVKEITGLDIKEGESYVEATAKINRSLKMVMNHISYLENENKRLKERIKIQD